MSPLVPIAVSGSDYSPMLFNRRARAGVLRQKADGRRRFDEWNIFWHTSHQFHPPRRVEEQNGLPVR